MNPLLEDYIENKVQELKFYEASYGKHLEAALKARDAVAKAEFEAFKVKTKALEPGYQARRAFTKSFPDFWLEAFRRMPVLSPLLDQVDEEALKQLKDFSVEYKEDPREFDFIFEFSSENPYFSNTKLVKEFRLLDIADQTSKELDLTSLKASDLKFPIISKPVAIDWTSDDHNLIKKKPRVNPEELEEFDEFEGLGSFFNFFQDTEDPLDIAEHLLDVYAAAGDIVAGLGLQDDDDDDESDDEDPTAEIDIEESEDEKQPKKRQRKD